MDGGMSRVTERAMVSEREGTAVQAQESQVTTLRTKLQASAALSKASSTGIVVIRWRSERGTRGTAVSRFLFAPQSRAATTQTAQLPSANVRQKWVVRAPEVQKVSRQDILVW